VRRPLPNCTILSSRVAAFRYGHQFLGVMHLQERGEVVEGAGAVGTVAGAEGIEGEAGTIAVTAMMIVVTMIAVAVDTGMMIDQMVVVEDTTVGTTAGKCVCCVTKSNVVPDVEFTSAQLECNSGMMLSSHNSRNVLFSSFAGSTVVITETVDESGGQS
jgi:hypothetical protein